MDRTYCLRISIYPMYLSKNIFFFYPIVFTYMYIYLSYFHPILFTFLFIYHIIFTYPCILYIFIYPILFPNHIHLSIYDIQLSIYPIQLSIYPIHLSIYNINLSTFLYIYLEMNILFILLQGQYQKSFKFHISILLCEKLISSKRQV